MSRTDIETNTEQLMAFEEHGVAVITLNRPEARNALNRAMIQGLQLALEIARQLAQGPALAYGYIKENFNRADAGTGVTECLDLEATHHVDLGLTQDHRDAANAFTEKRTPKFHGR